jgi:hypothetical protein
MDASIAVHSAAMFSHFGVNSLSSFRTKFFTYVLQPHLKSADAGCRQPPYSPSKPRTMWRVQDGPNSRRYIGQMLGGQRHGLGLFIGNGAIAPAAYIGRFEADKRNGPGIVLTPRGESYLGHFKDDLMWGPGVYTFPPPSLSSEGTAQHGGTALRYRVRYTGMHNGKPRGKGVLEWSDGLRECGVFDGMTCEVKESEKCCEGVVLCARQNLKEAVAVAAEWVGETKGRGLWEEAAASLSAMGVDGLWHDLMGGGLTHCG